MDGQADERMRRRVRLLIIAALVLLAVGVRLYRLDAPGVLVDRDFRSRIFARHYYLAGQSDVPGWRKEVARSTHDKLISLEPPVTEWMLARVYEMAGAERPDLGRLLTATFWIGGAVFLYAIVQSLVSAEAAVFAVAFYLLCPLGILLSRSLQPDSLMMLLFLGSLQRVIRFHERPSSRRLVIAVTLASLTVLLRPIVLFALLGAFIVPAIHRLGVRRALMDARTWLFTGMTLSLAAAYYVHAVVAGRSFTWQVETSFRPWLLVHREFWTGWFTLAVDAIGTPVLVAALLGAPMLRSGLPRATMVGLAGGYAVFGLLFTMHIHTHGYYHAQLIPIAALGAGPLVALVAGRLRETADRWWCWIPPAALMLVLAGAAAREVRAELGRGRFEAPAVAQRIGDVVNHSSRVVFLAPYYGMPLQYFGELTGAYWPRSVTYYLKRRGEPELTVDERLKGLGFTPEYFVITAFGEFERNHADLREYLAQRWELVADTKDYRIYRPPTAQVHPTETRP